MGNPSPQHNPTDGLGTAVKLALSGTGITQVVGNVYKVTLSLGGTSTVSVTTTVQDVGGNTFTSGNSNSATLVSRNTYVATVSGSTVTAVHQGQVVVDVLFPTFDTTDGVDKIYAQLLVTVTA